MALPAPKPNIDTCTACGKLFPRLSLRLCSQCARVEEHRFALVRDFLREHGDGCTVPQIATGTGLPMSDVRRFMDSGRLMEVANAGCTCGGVGERCRQCRSRLSTGLRDLEQSMQRDRGESPADGPGGAERTTYVRRIRRLGSDHG